MAPSRVIRIGVLLLGGSLGLLACSDVRETQEARRSCTSWQDEIKDLFTQRCSRCHSGDAPAGSYDTDSYRGVMGTGSDQLANVKAGEADSQLLAILDPQSADGNHRLESGEYEQVLDWVVTCKASYLRSAIHFGGIMNPADDDFHGKLLESRSWDFALCAKCHGDDFGGGKAKAACTTCHEKGPTSCETCHQEGARFAPGDAHPTHLLGGELGKTFDCEACHNKPITWDQEGHILLADGSVDMPPAEITFGALASTTLLAPGLAPEPPRWNEATKTCENVYCHQASPQDTANTRIPNPTWTEVGTGQAKCGSCHGLPPANHASDRCETCHSRVEDSTGKIVDAALHLNGEVEVGNGSTEKCAQCHGEDSTGAPPRDLDGNTSTSSIGVGAHASHLFSNRLRGPIACAECHLVPEQIDSPGHIDTASPAEVFTGLQSGLASADGAQPVFDRDNATCSGVYCHGNGNRLSTDVAATNRTPQWTRVDSSQARCGSCHGLPPDNGVHLQGLGLSECVNCHPSTVDRSGVIIISGPANHRTSNHMNGVVNLP